jgi:hypothetical protein
MKKIILLVMLSLSLLSCGGSASVVGNATVSQTNVELSRKNFKVLEKVTGVSTNTYILGIGGMSNKALVEKAKNDMMQKANLSGSKAVINITYDKHINGLFPFYSQVTITASGYIVEFTE